MDITLLGATGFIGRAVRAEALQRGHRVTALVRPGREIEAHPLLTIVEGDALDAAAVGRAVNGQDAVLVCLGVGGRGDGRPTTLVSDAVAVALAAMREHGVRRIVACSNLGAGGSGGALMRRVVLPVFLRRLRPILDDKDRMEALLRAGDADWTAVRLPNVVPGPAGVRLRVAERGDGVGLRITTGSVAAFLLDQLADDRLVRATPAVSA